MKRLQVVGLCSFVILLLVSTQAGSATPVPGKVKHTAAPVWTFAMDWPRVAYVSGNSIRVWNLATGVMSAVDGGRSTPAVQYVAGLALSGKQLFWLSSQQIGNSTLNHRLYSAPVGGSAHLLREMHGRRSMIYCDLEGPQMGGLAGSSSAVVVSTWDAGPDGTTPSKLRLALVEPSALSTVATGAKAILSQSVDGGHIAVLPLPTFSFTPDNGCNYVTLPANVLVYSTGGGLLAKVPLPARDPGWAGFQVAIRGNRLVVLAEGLHEPSGPAWVKLSVYDWTKPKYKRLHTWPVAIDLYPGVLNFSFYGSVAAVEGWADLHLVNLDTGKDVVIAPSSQTGCSTALGPQGLVYALNSDTAGQLVFVPMAKVLQLVS